MILSFLVLKLLFLQLIRGNPVDPSVFYFGRNENVNLNFFFVEHAIMKNDNQRIPNSFFEDDNFLKKRADDYFQPDTVPLTEDLKNNINYYALESRNIIPNEQFTKGFMEKLMDIAELNKNKIQTSSANNPSNVRVKRQGLSDNSVIIGTFQAMVRPMKIPDLGSTMEESIENTPAS